MKRGFDFFEFVQTIYLILVAPILVPLLLICLVGYIFYEYTIYPIGVWVEETFEVRILADNRHTKKLYDRYGLTPWWDEEENEENSQSNNENTEVVNTVAFISSDGRKVEYWF